MARKLEFEFTFQPLIYLSDSDRTALESRLLAADMPTYFTLPALQRKHLWAFAVPIGTFANDFSGAVTADAERAARDQLILSMKTRWFRKRDIVERDGVAYYQRNVLDRFRIEVSDDAQRAMFRALLKCMDDAERDRSVVKGIVAREGLSPDQRRAIFGHNKARGIDWTPQEDAVLRRWFGPRTVGEHAGRHAPLTEEQWGMVLDDLRGIRSKHAVQSRINALNGKLMTELLQRQHMHYGLKKGPKWLRAAFVPEYMSRVLGERPRKPPTHPASRRHDASAPRDVQKTLESRWEQELEPRSSVQGHEPPPS